MDVNSCHIRDPEQSHVRPQRALLDQIVPLRLHRVLLLLIKCAVLGMRQTDICVYSN